MLMGGKDAIHQFRGLHDFRFFSSAGGVGQEPNDGEPQGHFTTSYVHDVLLFLQWIPHLRAAKRLEWIPVETRAGRRPEWGLRDEHAAGPLKARERPPPWPTRPERGPSGAGNCRIPTR